MGKAGWLGRVAARRAGVPITVHTYHGHTFSGYWSGWRNCLQKAVERRLSQSTSAIIAQSPSQSQEIGDILARRDHIHVIEPGVDFSRIDSDHRGEDELRRSLELRDARVVTFIGRLAAIKNCASFLDVMSKVVARLDGKVVALIVGGGTPAEQANLQDHARAAKIENHCRWLGYRSDIGNLLRITDVVVSTSINEGTPLNLIEALASETPIVATDVGGVRDTVGDYRQTKLCEPGQIDELSSAILEHLCSPQRSGNLDSRRSDSDDVRERFSHTRLIEETAQLYRDLSRDLPEERS
jgi:glycosyltransferase involved in cell wall biosynthesis